MKGDNEMNLMIIDRIGNKKLWTDITEYTSFGSTVKLYKKNKCIAEYIPNNLIGWYEIEDDKIQIEELLMRLGK